MRILAALQAAGMCNLFTQGIAALSPGLNSPGPLGRLDGRILGVCAQQRARLRRTGATTALSGGRIAPAGDTAAPTEEMDPPTGATTPLTRATTARGPTSP